MQIRFVCDLQPERARAALLAAGYDNSAFVSVGSNEEATTALNNGQIIITADYRLISGLALDCVVEATGSPEAAAQVGQITLMSGFHLVMITKEADIVVGPYLHKLAKAAGRHVTPAHGDQPSLLIALLSWAEVLGMKVIGAGKSSEYDFVLTLRLSRLAGVAVRNKFRICLIFGNFLVLLRIQFKDVKLPFLLSQNVLSLICVKWALFATIPA